jgi:hypothetical protein
MPVDRLVRLSEIEYKLLLDYVRGWRDYYTTKLKHGEINKINKATMDYWKENLCKAIAVDMQLSDAKYITYPY